MNNKIIITGANGQLGHCLKDVSKHFPQYKFVYTDVAELDITNHGAIADFFTTEKPSWVVNVAAYTAVDKAETDIKMARFLNATAVVILAQESANVKAGFVQISTDLYHFSDEGATCWTDFAQQIMDLSGLNCTIRGITTVEHSTPAKRPAFSVMSKA